MNMKMIYSLHNQPFPRHTIASPGESGDGPEPGSRLSQPALLFANNGPLFCRGGGNYPVQTLRDVGSTCCVQREIVEGFTRFGEMSLHCEAPIHAEVLQCNLHYSLQEEGCSRDEKREKHARSGHRAGRRRQCAFSLTSQRSPGWGTAAPFHTRGTETRPGGPPFPSRP